MGRASGILIHMQHPGEQHDRRRASGQGHVACQAHPQAFIRNNLGDDHYLLPLPRNHRPHIHRHSGTGACICPGTCRNVFVLLHSRRGTGVLPCCFGNRKHKDSIPSGACRPGHIHAVLLCRHRMDKGGHSCLLDCRTCLCRCPAGMQLVVYAQRTLEKPQNLILYTVR